LITQLQEKDQRVIREKYKEIDDILTRECLFCGGFLIDMIDNDLTIEEDNDQDLEEDIQPDPSAV